MLEVGCQEKDVVTLEADEEFWLRVCQMAKRLNELAGDIDMLAQIRVGKAIMQYAGVWVRENRSEVSDRRRQAHLRN